MIAMVTTEVNRMGYMPGPPWWKCVEIAVSMERPLREIRMQVDQVWTRRKCKARSTVQLTEMSRVAQISTWLGAVASRDASRRNATAHLATRGTHARSSVNRGTSRVW